MQPEVAVQPEAADVNSSSPNTGASGTQTTVNGADPPPNGTAAAAANGSAVSQFPPPKTDKPRPHVCGTCSRSFARLEHLKRHERSHTKEKPFECPECTRCFARRDLLLRHQQKLHMTSTARGPKSGRRESVSGTAANNGAKVRKNSVANANVGGLASNTTRPRANTISHLDISSLGIFDGAHPDLTRMHSAGLGPAHLMHGAIHAPMGFDYRGMPNPMGHHHSNMHALPKLDTIHINHSDMSNSLRTAPPQATFADFDLDHIYPGHNTINPAALHSGGMGQMPASNMPFSAFEVNTHMPIGNANDLSWMRSWNSQFQSGFDNEQAIDESSPSRMSSGDSPGDANESLANSGMGMPMQNGMQWPHQHDSTPPQQDLSQAAFHIDSLPAGLPDLDISADTLSPSQLHDPTSAADSFFHQVVMQHAGPQQQHQHSPPLQQQQQQQQQNHLHQQQHLQQHQHQQQHISQPRQALNHPELMPGQTSQHVGQALSNFGSDSPSMSSSSMNGSARQSSVTSMSTESITDSTRHALLASLSQPSTMLSSQTTRKYSQPSVSSPLSPGNARMAVSNQGPTLPSTSDIKRYVEAFIQYAHPHLPAIHIPTLTFDSIDPAASPQASSTTAPSAGAASQTIASGGARCLILGMAAIGALYEYEHRESKELFEAAKKMIQLYIEERRRANNGGADNGETPLWLVQAMLLTVIYGHHCGDRMSAGIASGHIAALVSLARQAKLAQPPMTSNPACATGTSQMPDVDMDESAASSGSDLRAQWYRWKTAEERKRVLYAIFILSSLLTTAYNQAPTIVNSEIMLELPCAEELWIAETPEEWHSRGGLAAAEADSVSFAVALSTLLCASQRQAAQNRNASPGNTAALDSLGRSDLKPSTFGCLVLINALHNYIWETRNRHNGKEWTPQETEAMFAHIEPALTAWQAAWKSHEYHKLERPNPFGLGPLAADSIPLLDLAFVRLFVNLGRTAEAFWRRDFDGMADQLAQGGDVTVAAPPAEKSVENGDAAGGATSDSPGKPNALSQPQNADQGISRRERYFRKAAFYAADALTVACTYNLTYTDPIAHELPIQSAICFFDSAQVLAEWVTSVQERVGRIIGGVLGRDAIDCDMPPAIMMLEAEDMDLLRKIEHICTSLEAKRQQHESLLAMDINSLSPTTATRSSEDVGSCGLGSKILKCVAMTLEKAVIWPITHVMARGLEVEATHMERRAQASIQQ